MASVVILDFNTMTAANPSAVAAGWLKPTIASPAQIATETFKVFALVHQLQYGITLQY
jgi:hypothetical protein